MLFCMIFHLQSEVAQSIAAPHSPSCMMQASENPLPCLTSLLCGRATTRSHAVWSYHMPRYPQVCHRLLYGGLLERGSQECLQSLRENKSCQSVWFVQLLGQESMLGNEEREGIQPALTEPGLLVSLHFNRQAKICQFHRRSFAFAGQKQVLRLSWWPNLTEDAILIESCIVFVWFKVKRREKKQSKTTTTTTCLQKLVRICNQPPKSMTEIERKRKRQTEKKKRQAIFWR